MVDYLTHSLDTVLKDNQSRICYISGPLLERVSKFTLLGLWQQDKLCWSYHVEQTVKKASDRLYYLRECRKANVTTEIGITLYCSEIRPLLEYASPVWDGLHAEIPCR